MTEVEHQYVQNGGHTTYLVSSGTGVELRSRLASAVVEGGWELLRLQSVGMTLEEIFIEVTTDENLPDLTSAVVEEAQQG